MFNKNNKGQGLSINTIILAALAVVVLVVLIAIFTGRLGMFSSVLSSTNAEKTKDSALNSCIPMDKYYQNIEIAQIEYNKDESTRENLDKEIQLKNDELANCKGNNIVNACASSKCQWVGN